MADDLSKRGGRRTGPVSAPAKTEGHVHCDGAGEGRGRAKRSKESFQGLAPPLLWLASVVPLVTPILTAFVEIGEFAKRVCFRNDRDELTFLIDAIQPIGFGPPAFNSHSVDLDQGAPIFARRDSGAPNQQTFEDDVAFPAIQEYG
jgi:hypothetical protein